MNTCRGQVPMAPGEPAGAAAFDEDLAAPACQQPVLPHELRHPVLGDPDPLGRRQRFHLPVALPQEPTRLRRRRDLRKEFFVAQ